MKFVIYLQRNLKRKSIIFLFIGTIISCIFVIRSTIIDENEILSSYDEFNCGCQRYGRFLTREERAEKLLCSEWATVRGEWQNVISYSIFGGRKINIFRTFYSQIEERIREARFYYPGWIVRLYHNTTEEKEDKPIMDHLCKLYCKYPNFDLCNTNKIYMPSSWNLSSEDILKSKNSTMGIQALLLSVLNLVKNKTLSKSEGVILKAIPSSIVENETSTAEPTTSKRASKPLHSKLSLTELLAAKMWRFSPMADPLVDMFLIRDLDSYILPREVDAVQEWIQNTSLSAHSMRDHPSHNGVILAGLWGGSRKRGGEILEDIFKKSLWYPSDPTPGYDQQILREVFWPSLDKHMLVHDSYHCRNPFLKGYNAPRPFPTKRRGWMFVSWGPFRTPNELTLIGPCPLACRPKKHRDWNFC